MSKDTTFEMHVARKGDASAIKPREYELPSPGKGEVRVKIEAAGVAYVDILLRRGYYTGRPLPETPGYDFIGRIEAIGEGVTEFSVGQRVGGVTEVGCYATRRNVDARWLVPAPEKADADALVAVVLNGLTAWQMLNRIANPITGEWILVHGAAGGVGSLLIDFARLQGIKTIGTASSGKTATVFSRGAVPIDYASEDVVARTKDISGGGVVAAFDHIAGKHFKTISMPSLKPGGIGVIYGAYNLTRGGTMHPLALADARFNGGFSAFKLFSESKSVATYAIPAWRNARTEVYRRDLARIFSMVAAGEVKPLIGATLSLQEAPEAHRLMERRAVAGKIVLLCGDE